jgi:hypothetical protein
MALQICQFVATVNLSGIPANRVFAIPNPVNSQSLLLPTNKNVLIKKISVDCVYNQSGDLCISDYTLQFFPIQFNTNIINVNNGINVNNFFLDINGILINKKNNMANLNILAAGLKLNLFSSNFPLQSSLVLSNTTSPITSNASFLITFYYE